VKDMKVSETAGGIVLNPKGDVLIITNEIGKVTLPKGRLEPGESRRQAAIREVLEEGGLKNVQLIEELGTIIRPGYTDENHDTPTVMKHIRMFFFTTNEFELDPKVSDIQKAEWVNPKNVAAKLDWIEEADFFQKHYPQLATSGI
jgi:ADP-ribose pyrophosphatase YjhB (NUDIX family)